MKSLLIVRKIIQLLLRQKIAQDGHQQALPVGIILSILCSCNGWFLAEIKYRKEKIVQNTLSEKGYLSYCPMVIYMSKTIPLFPGYLFLYIDNHDIYHDIKYVPGFKRLIQFNSTMHSCDGIRSSKQFDLNPLQNGEEIIKDVKYIESCFNKKLAGSENKKFTPGEMVFCKKNGFQHLESTFIKNLNNDRGLVLIKFIESRIKKDGFMVKRVLGSKRVDVKINDIESVNNVISNQGD